MKGKILITVAAVAAGGVFGAVKDEVHGYTPKGYVQPKEPEVRERLEWFKDQKLALMMCLGLYSNIGIKESWPLSDADARAVAADRTRTIARISPADSFFFTLFSPSSPRAAAHCP